jgi:hypothetical protein
VGRQATSHLQKNYINDITALPGSAMLRPSRSRGRRHINLGDITMIRPRSILTLAVLGLGATLVSTVSVTAADKLTNVQGTNCNCTPPPGPVAQAVPTADVHSPAADGINYSTDKRTNLHGTNSYASIPAAPAIMAQQRK